jgi:hypothetical protein
VAWRPGGLGMPLSVSSALAYTPLHARFLLLMHAVDAQAV